MSLFRSLVLVALQFLLVLRPQSGWCARSAGDIRLLGLLAQVEPAPSSR